MIELNSLLSTRCDIRVVTYNHLPGLSATGDSFLLGSVLEKKMLNELVFGKIEDVRSCLDEESLALTLLHLIGSGF